MKKADMKPFRTNDRSTTSTPSMRFFTTARLSENIHETPEGFLVCIGVPVAHTSEMQYGPGESPLEVGPDGIATVSRPAEILFADETIASFEGKAVTIEHPPTFISPENWSQLAVGILQNVRRGTGEHENDLLADLLITAKRAIELVKKGLREVSLGYDAWYVQTGVGRGVQTKIIGNHLALVEEGRAGAGYAIKDHKGKGTMKLSDRIKAIFGKAQDDALKLVADNDEVETDEAEKAPTNDAVMKALAKLDRKIDAIGKKAKTKDAVESEADADEPARAKAKDDDMTSSLEDRLAKLEKAVAKLLARETKEDEVPVTDDGEGDDMVTDEEMDVEVEDEDLDGEYAADEAAEEKEEKKAKTGDRRGPKNGGDDDEDEEELAARVEILAPGLDASRNDVRRKALIAAYATKDGKRVIERFTNGKRPNFKDAAFVNSTFVAASELLKVERNSDFAGTKSGGHRAKDSVSAGALSAEQLNEKNEKYYATKFQH